MFLQANSNLNGAIEALEVMEKLETKKGTLAELWRSALIPEEGEFKVLKHGYAQKLLNFQML